MRRYFGFVGIIGLLSSGVCLCTIHHPVCASVVIVQRTVTGHEADMPITLCGMRSGSWICKVVNGPLQAHAKLECYEGTP